jgi:hypothetical protein
LWHVGIKKKEFDVVCKIDQFRHLSNLNGLTLLDSTYLERLISDFLKRKEIMAFECSIYLENLQLVFKVTTVKGVKKILDRLESLYCLPLYKKVGKHHENKYIISINLKYTKYFFIS